jgi:capsular exopolysaccharide synthesis family protein
VIARNPYIDFILKWYWLLALGLVVALVATHFALARRVPIYSATATIQIGRALEETNPNQDDIAITERLAPGYAEIAKRDPILLEVANNLGIDLSPAAIRSQLLIQLVPQTQLIDIHVLDTDPTRGAALANEIARQVVLQSPSSSASGATRTFVETQLADLQEKITDGEARIEQLEDDIAEMTSAADINSAQQQMNAIRIQIDTWQGTFATMLTSIQPSNTNTIRIVSDATPAGAPEPVPTTMYYGMGGMVGVGLGSLFALALSMYVGTVKRSEDLAEIAETIPVITIPYYRRAQESSPITIASPDSNAAGAYRVLRNALQAYGTYGNASTIAVTSSRTGEGKSTTAANLAAAVANGGRKVLLIDANFRNPKVDRFYHVPSDPGLSDAIFGRATLHETMQDTAHPNLRVVASGTVSSISADILSSRRTEQTIASLSEFADITLIDAGALQEEQDALLLARSAAGVLIVAEARRVRPQELRQSLDMLRRSNTTVVAVVLNKARVPMLSRFFSLREHRARPQATLPALPALDGPQPQNAAD